MKELEVVCCLVHLLKKSILDVTAVRPDEM